MKFMPLLLYLGLCAAMLLSCVAVAEDGPIVVSLGDSYSSGEGIEPFYGQDKPLFERATDQDWLGHRSEKSWPGQLRVPGLDGTLSEHRGVYVLAEDGSYTLEQDGNWFFVAATGAQCRHLMEAESQKVSRKENGVKVKGTMTLYPQLDIFQALAVDGKKADYVTLTLGGNDVGFVGLLVRAAVNGPLLGNPIASFLGEESDYSLQTTVADIWNTFYDTEGPRSTILNAYRAVAKAAGPQATIIVAGYPLLVSEESQAILGGESAAILNRSVTRFNEEIEAIVNELAGEGIDIHFVSVEAEFLGHEAYAPDTEYINRLIFGPEKQDHSSALLVSMYSMHPNELGTQAYARCVQAKIDELQACIALNEAS